MASERQFRILFQAKIRGEVDEHQLRQELRALFDLDLPTLERLFSGEPVVIKTTADEALAKRFADKIAQLGGVCWYEEKQAGPYRDRRQGPRRKLEQPPAEERRQRCGRRYEDLVD